VRLVHAVQQDRLELLEQMVHLEAQVIPAQLVLNLYICICGFLSMSSSQHLKGCMNFVIHLLNKSPLNVKEKNQLELQTEDRTNCYLAQLLIGYVQYFIGFGLFSIEMDPHLFVDRASSFPHCEQNVIADDCLYLRA
jgi:hypothetical protein